MPTQKKTQKDGIECIVIRDIWDEEGRRIPAGPDIITLPAEKAIDYLESGNVSRAK